MAIKAECGECGRVYHVKDDLNGKKIRCRECQGVIVVQADQEDDLEDIYEEQLELPVKKSKSKKAKRRPSGPPMPISIIVALVCLVMMFGLTILECFGLDEDVDGVKLDRVRVAGRTIGVVLRGIIQLVVFVGVFRGKAGVVTPSIAMGVFAALMAIGTSLVSWNQPDGDIIVGLLVFYAVLRVFFIVSILSPTAADYMTN